MKRTTVILIASTLILSFAAFSVAATEADVGVGQYMLGLNGDVNGDGVINNLDAATVLKYDAGIVTEFYNKKPELLSLEQQHENKVVADFLNFKNCDESDAGYIKEIKSFGMYGSCEILWIDLYKSDIDMTYYNDVGGYYIEEYKYSRIFVYKDGEFLKLNKALKEGLISSDDVFEVVKRMGAVLPVRYYKNVYVDKETGITVENVSELKDIGVTIVNRIGDVNCDRTVNNTDASLILKYDAGLIGT